MSAGAGPGTGVLRRAAINAVALETTLLLHGVPRGEGAGLAADLARDVREGGGEPAVVGVVSGRAIVGLDEGELGALLAAPRVPKANTANLGALLHQRSHGATTVSTTMELAAAAGVRVFATGGLGGVHRGFAARPDVSADLAALARFPVAVVSSGVKGLLDVEATREVLETLGVPVVGYRTDTFPAFYLRHSDARVDARFDDAHDLARFLAGELRRTGRGVAVCNPIPPEHEPPRAAWEGWLREARVRAGEASGRDATPAILAALHEVSQGATLRANIALVRSNARLAGTIAGAIARESSR